MPASTIIDLSILSAEELREEIEALQEEHAEALQRLAQIEHDIAAAEEELEKR